MDYSRRDFLRIVTVLPATGTAWFFSSAARAGAAAEEAYAEARADKIHKNSTDDEIRQSGKTPEEVKAEVDRRIRELRANSST
jgi:hypothetical protein